MTIKKSEEKFKAWDKKLKKMRWVLSLSFEEWYAILKDKPEDKIPLTDIELLRYMGVRSENRKGIYEGDIVSFRDGDEEVIGIVIREENGEWFFHIPLSDKRLSPWQLKKIHVSGNKYENAYMLSEEWARKMKIAHIQSVISSSDICSREYCRHDLENAMKKLSDLSREELIEMVKYMAESLRDYKKAYFEEALKERRKR